MPIPKPINQYYSSPLIIGTPSDYTRPLVLELIDKGQGREILTLLHSVNLRIVEKSYRPGFKIYTINNNKKNRFYLAKERI